MDANCIKMARIDSGWPLEVEASESVRASVVGVTAEVNARAVLLRKDVLPLGYLDLKASMRSRVSRDKADSRWIGKSRVRSNGVTGYPRMTAIGAKRPFQTPVD